MRLTYADRDLFLNTLDALRNTWRETDGTLLAQSAAWASRLRPQFGFEEGLTRDMVFLSRFLSSDSGDEIREVARGGLLYVLQAGKREDRLAAFGLFDDAFVASYCVHEIQSRLGQDAQYTPPRLLPAERNRAEELFLSFMGQTSIGDVELIADSRKTVVGLGILGESGIFRRLTNNVEFLIRVLSSPEARGDHRDCARAGLNYLTCEQDAIGDDLGLVGFLDDNFIVQMAVELIEPARDPWLDLFDGTVAAWPFLNAVLLGENGAVRRLSEFMLVNAALVCPALRGGSEQTRIVVVTPRVGPIPLLIGVVRALSVAYELSQTSESRPTFRAGQAVLVDYETIRIFTGMTVIDGREYFGLQRSGSASGKRGTRIDYRPLRDLHRLTPAPSNKTTRGVILRDSERTLHPLDHLFVGSGALRALGGRQVVVATDTGKARELASTLTLHGHPLREVMPMGHLSASGDITRWSERFGTQPPLLLFAHDLDHACEQIESAPELTKLVIVDGESRNASRSASAVRIAGMGTAVLVVTPTAQSDNVIDTDDAAVWEWTDDDLSTLLWPEEGPEENSRPVTSFERRLHKGARAAIDLQIIEHPASRKAFAALEVLKNAAEDRGEDPLADLDDAVDLAFGMLTRLVRCPVPLAAWRQGVTEIETALGKLESVAHECNFVAPLEKEKLLGAHEALGALLQDLRGNNIKAHAVREVVATHPDMFVVCAARDVAQAAEAGGIRAVSVDHLRKTVELSCGAIFPGWYGRAKMAGVLLPPIATPLMLILYDLEAEWYRGFNAWRRRGTASRSKRSDRARIFPGMKGWRHPPVAPSLAVRPIEEQAFAGFESVQSRVWEDRRRRLVQESGSNGTENEVRAKLVLFDCGGHAFLSESYRAKVATHLLRGSDDRTEAELEQVRVGQLKTGDALLFRRGADSDVLRVLADAMLPPGTRSRSAAWKRALREYMAADLLTGEKVWDRLRAAGCPIGEQAVRNWIADDDLIAPLSYQRDIATIAQVTGNETLSQSLIDCLEAVRQVRGAHLRASHVLAGQVVARVLAALQQGETDTATLDIDDDVVLVRIAAIDDGWAQVRTSLANRLQEGST